MPVSQIPPSKTAFADDALHGKLAPEARQLIETIRDEWAADERGALTRSERNKLLGVGPTRGRELESEGLPAYLEGRTRLTRAGDVYKFLVQRALNSFPLTGPVKGRGSPLLQPRKPELVLTD